MTPRNYQAIADMIEHGMFFRFHRNMIITLLYCHRQGISLDVVETLILYTGDPN